jgi:hypothetical protein
VGGIICLTISTQLISILFFLNFASALLKNVSLAKNIIISFSAAAIDSILILHKIGKKNIEASIHQEELGD